MFFFVCRFCLSSWLWSHNNIRKCSINTLELSHLLISKSNWLKFSINYCLVETLLNFRKLSFYTLLQIIIIRINLLWRNPTQQFPVKSFILSEQLFFSHSQFTWCFIFLSLPFCLFFFYFLFLFCNKKSFSTSLLSLTSSSSKSFLPFFSNTYTTTKSPFLTSLLKAYNFLRYCFVFKLFTLILFPFVEFKATLSNHPPVCHIFSMGLLLVILLFLF